MFKHINVFQVIFLSGFIFIAVMGVLVAGSFHGKNAATNIPTSVIWGTIPESQFGALKNAMSDDQTFKVSYIRKSKNSIDSELVQALAVGEGPDIIILPKESVLTEKIHIYPIPYMFLSQELFRKTFIQAGENYMIPEGSLALPFSVDPMVMYWNRDIFSTVGIALPPKTWEEFLSIAKIITSRDQNNNILKSAVALGDYDNVSNAKDIIVSLLLQIGALVVKNDNGKFIVDLPSESEVISVLNFYTQFSNPLNQVYSWNHGLPLSTEYFLANNLGIYFGFASELNTLRSRNPNLNFDIAQFPQLSNSKTPAVFGEMMGVSVLKTSSDINNSIRIAGLLTSKKALAALNEVSGLPPVRRDMLAIMPTNDFGPVYYRSALLSKDWLDPNVLQTDLIFKKMVDSIVSGAAIPDQALSEAHDRMDVLLRQFLR